MIGLPIDGNKQSRFSRKTYFMGFAIILVLITFLTNYLKIRFSPTPVNVDLCPIHEPISPDSFNKDNSTVLKILHDKAYRNESVERLAGAIQIDTQIFDHQPDVDEAPEIWIKFQKFHDYLNKTFPLVYKHLEIQKVNTYGLVYIYKGSQESLKPVLLAAHQDTVPVQKDTIANWSYPPLSGHYDGDYIYGRGAADCKNVLIAILETFEILLSQKYKPNRTIIAAFGFDEESSGLHGARHIGEYLEDRFGKDSIYAVIDEGPGITIDSMTKTIFAIPGTGEKGYVDIITELTTPGGHSSIPPDHTSIGIMAELAYLIESDPYSPILTDKNPTLNYYQCLALHDPHRNIPRNLKGIILRAGVDRHANARLLSYIQQNPLTRYLVRTSQALDIILGGEKANALPEHVSLLTNHRIAIESNLDLVRDHFISRVIDLADKHRLSIRQNGKFIYEVPDPAGVFDITELSALEPAPSTPTNDNVWKYLAGVTRHVFEELVFTDLDYPIVMSPAIMTGNTDTKYYWGLSKNIFRYSPYFVANLLNDTNAHRVDEKLIFDGHLQLQAFFYEYVQAIDSEKADNE